MAHPVQTNTTVYFMTAIDKSIETKNYGEKSNDKYIPNDPNKIVGLVSSITIGVGSGVMLRNNINVQKGFVNGAMGIVTSIKWPALRRNQLEQGELPQ